MMTNDKKQPAATLRTRREFVKGSTAAVVGGSLLGTLNTSRFAHAAGDDTIKIGLIGCGGRGTGAVKQALQTTTNVKLVAIGDAYKDRLDQCVTGLAKDKDINQERVALSEDRKYVGLDAYEKVLASGIDLVILATPPGFRPAHFKAAVEAGKHVFMEKPVAVDAAGVRTVLAAAQAAKKKNLGVGVGLQRRHQYVYQETIKRLQDGVIGDIVTSRVYWNGAGVWDPKPRTPKQTEMDYQIRNWYYYTWLSGDHIVEQHIHNIDVINWLKNAYPVSAQGMGGRQVRVAPEFGEIYDHHAVEFVYGDGSRMYSFCRHIPNCWNGISEHVQGTSGTADISGAAIMVKGGEAWKYRGDKNNPYQTEHDDLIASIRAGSPLNEGEYGALSSMTAILGRMCTYSGAMLNFQDALDYGLTLGPKDGINWDTTPPAPSVAVPGVTAVADIPKNRK